MDRGSGEGKRPPGPGRLPGFFQVVFNKIFPPYASKADRYRQRLSVMYAVFAWNAVGFLLYYHFSRKDKERDPKEDNWMRLYSREAGDEKHSPSLEWANALKIPGDARVIRMKGFTKVSDEVVERPDV